MLVEKYERKIVVLNEEMGQRLQDRTSHIPHWTQQWGMKKRISANCWRWEKCVMSCYIWSVGTRNSFPASVCLHGLMG